MSHIFARIRKIGNKYLDSDVLFLSKLIYKFWWHSIIKCSLHFSKPYVLSDHHHILQEGKPFDQDPEITWFLQMPLKKNSERKMFFL